MSRLFEDTTPGSNFYETGVRNGVLFKKNGDAYGTGVAWKGLTAVTESPSGAEATPMYADDIKYLNLMSKEEFGATIEAFTYPDEFAECDGSANLITGNGLTGKMFIGQQPRKAFAFAYKTALGNDTDGYDHGYKIHLVYNALAAPSEKAYATVNESPEAITMSWEITTTPVKGIINDKEYTTATLVISTADFTTAGVLSDNFKAFEDYIYGTADSEPSCPTLLQAYNLLTTGSADGVVPTPPSGSGE